MMGFECRYSYCPRLNHNQRPRKCSTLQNLLHSSHQLYRLWINIRTWSSRYPILLEMMKKRIRYIDYKEYVFSFLQRKIPSSAQNWEKITRPFSKKYLDTETFKILSEKCIKIQILLRHSPKKVSRYRYF